MAAAVVVATVVAAATGEREGEGVMRLEINDEKYTSHVKRKVRTRLRTRMLTKRLSVVDRILFSSGYPPRSTSAAIVAKHLFFYPFPPARHGVREMI